MIEHQCGKPVFSAHSRRYTSRNSGSGRRAEPVLLTEHGKRSASVFSAMRSSSGGDARPRYSWFRALDTLWRGRRKRGRELIFILDL